MNVRLKRKMIGVMFKYLTNNKEDIKKFRTISELSKYLSKYEGGMLIENITSEKEKQIITDKIGECRLYLKVILEYPIES